MKPVEREVVFDRFVVAIGVRSAVGDDGPNSWEVYVRLVSGNDVILHRGCLRHEALTLMKYRASMASGGSMMAFIPTEDGSLVSLECVARVYVDRTHKGHVCIIEDSTGKGYPVVYGSENDCTVMVHKLAATINTYVSMTGDDDEPDGPAIAETAA